MQSAAVIALLFSQLFFDATTSQTLTELNSGSRPGFAGTRIDLLPLPSSLLTRKYPASTAASPLGTVTTLRSDEHGSFTSTTTFVGERTFSAAVRRLSQTARVLSDDHGGWRLEKTHITGSLQSVEDQFGPIVNVINDSLDRPVGVLLNSRLAVEYIYAGANRPWERKVLYDLDSGTILAAASNERAESVWDDRGRTAAIPLLSSRGPMAELTHTGGTSWDFVISLEGTPYARLPMDGQTPVVRSVQIGGPSSSTGTDRIDYTESEMVVHLSAGDSKTEVVVAISRTMGDDGVPLVITDELPGADRLLTALTVGAPATALGDKTEPTRHASLSITVTEVLTDGHALALERVRSLPACMRLFEPFAVSGNERLTSTFYSPPRPFQEDNSCDKGALAYTHVGSPVTYLCGSFGTLQPEQAAVVLIHEALHFAGMKEAPSSPNALASQEISKQVLRACGF